MKTSSENVRASDAGAFADMAKLCGLMLLLSLWANLRIDPTAGAGLSLPGDDMGGGGCWWGARTK
jgi:hypothetical protein